MTDQDPFWNMKESLAKDVAQRPNATLSDLNAAFQEEFGALPAKGILEIFQKTRREAQAATPPPENQPPIKKLEQGAEKPVAESPEKPLHMESTGEEPEKNMPPGVDEGGQEVEFKATVACQDPDFREVLVSMARMVFGDSCPVRPLEGKEVELESETGLLLWFLDGPEDLTAMARVCGGNPLLCVIAIYEPEQKEFFSAALAAGAADALSRDAVSVGLLGRITRLALAAKPHVSPKPPPGPNLEEVLSTSPLAVVFLTDENGLITHFSKGASRIFGYTPEEVTGKVNAAQLHVPSELESRKDLLPENGGKDLCGFEILAALAREKISRELEWTIEKKDGKHRIANMSYIPRESFPWGFVVSAMDVTAIRIARDKLWRAQQEAAAAVQNQADQIERLSLAIRTPMNALAGFSDLLMESSLTPAQADHVRMITKNSRALMAVVNDLLDFSRIEEGELDLVQQEFDMESLVLEVCENVRSRAGSKPLAVECTVDPALPEKLSGDPARFRQVLTNLLGNAIQFTQDGEVRLNADVEEENTEQVKVRVTVLDTGPGMDADKLASIFVPFTNKQSRTGPRDLSLALCKHVAQLMRGDIVAESTPGEGSSFFFTCWLGKVREDKTPVRAPRMLSGRTACIILDNEQNADKLSMLLTEAGMRVVALNNGIEAVPTLQRAKAAGNPLDVLLCDLQMPGMNGYQVAKQVRLLGPNFQRLPLVALSTVKGLDPGLAADAGFDAVLSTPIRKKNLFDTLVRAMGKGAVFSIADKPEDPCLKILLAEDDPDNFKLAKFILSKAGHTVEGAKSGNEALERFQGNPQSFDCVLMDVQMPEMDGYEATRALRKLGFDRVPVIALTAHALPEDKDRCLTAGMNDYLPKPISKDSLLAMVDKWGKRSAK